MKTLLGIAALALSLPLVACSTPTIAEGQGSTESHLEDDGSGDIQDPPTDIALMREILSDSDDSVVALGYDGNNGGIATASVKPSFGLKPQGITDGLVNLEQLTLQAIPACTILRNFRPAEHAFFFSGISGTAEAVVQGNVGYEAVVDVYNQQAAVFQFNGLGISGSIGVSVGMYEGMGLDLNARVGSDIRDVWGGVFESASASVGVEKFLSINVSGFVSQDRTVAGGAVGASVGIGRALADVGGVSVAANNYTFDGDKTAMFFGGDGSAPTYLSGTKDVVFAVMKASSGFAYGGISNAVVSTFVITALLNAKNHGVSISQLCP